METFQARGIRNNNPGNIKYDGTSWQGHAEPPTDGIFCRFMDAKYGIRAIAKIVSNYFYIYNLNCVWQIISRWAPPSENDTVAYAEFVAREIGRGMYDAMDVGKNIFGITRAIIRFENGTVPYSDAEIKQGIKLC